MSGPIVDRSGRKLDPRLVLAAASVAVIAGVVALAIALGPSVGRRWLLLSGALALIAAVQSAVSDPRDLTLAYLFSLPAVIALISDGSPTWLIGPLGALLLLAGELGTLGWECQSRGVEIAFKRTRMVNVGVLCGVGLVGSLVVAVFIGR